MSSEFDRRAAKKLRKSLNGGKFTLNLLWPSKCIWSLIWQGQFQARTHKKSSGTIRTSEFVADVAELSRRTPSKSRGKTPRKWVPAGEQSGVFSRRIFNYKFNVLKRRHLLTVTLFARIMDSQLIDIFVGHLREKNRWPVGHTKTKRLIRMAMTNMDSDAIDISCSSSSPTCRKGWPPMVAISSDFLPYISS